MSAAPGSLVWLNVEDTPAWVRAKVESTGQTVKLQRLDNDATIDLAAEAFQQLRLAAPDHTPPVEDLTQLEDSSDATFLDALRRRYAADLIYTAIGPVIISVNPYKAVSGCTSEAISNLCQLGTSAPPHVARVATVAFNGMTAMGGESRAQSILVSGESGAGKTEACKLCLLALAELSHSSGQATELALESAELLEAFGNAKTVYNENSSRFGKWCAVYFDRTPHIVACQTEVYLLEKTRIIGPPAGERNYHLFYQMLAGASAEERAVCKLAPSAADYEYVKHGVIVLDGVDDAREWASTTRKLEVLGLGGARMMGMMRLFSAVLAIGNFTFRPATAAAAAEADGLQEVVDTATLTTVAGLLEVDAKALSLKLTTRVISTGKGSSTYTVPLAAGECNDTRDALAKAVYHELFQWLVAQLNEVQAGGGQRDTSDEERFVGLLDIFGFENFRKNSFEQLCINFTNERLQAHFMDALVKLKLEDYRAEAIDCTAIDFPDNAAQLKLIDHKSLGIFALLDDECSVPKGTEQSFVDKLAQAFLSGRTASACFDKGKRGKGGILVGEKLGTPFPSHGALLDAMSFVVVHYAESVQYTADGWLDKNRGYLHPDVGFVLTQSKSSLLCELFPPSSVDVAKKSTVSSTFRKSLRDLSTTMLQTSQNYLRCIKPNGLKQPDAFDGHFVLRQLRYTGVASVVEIQRSGYPIALSQIDFIGRYRCIAFHLPTLLAATQSPAQICTNLLRAAPGLAGLRGSVDWLATKDAQIGKTRVYMRDEVGKVLEKPRLAATRKAAVSIQRFHRGVVTRRVTSLMLMHARGAALVRAHIAACSVSAAGAALDELAAKWKSSRLERALALSALLPPMHAELEQLELEIVSLEQGLEAEADALEDLRGALAAASESGIAPKDAYITLKVALASALDVSRGLRPELTEAIAAAEAALSSCLTGLGLSADAAKAALANLRTVRSQIMLTKTESAAHIEDDEAIAARLAAEEAAREAAEAQAAKTAEAAEAARQQAELAAWEAEVARQAAEKEHERRVRQAAYEQELVQAAAQPEPAWLILTVVLSNDADAESSVYKQLVGYSVKITGVAFSEKNVVTMIRPGSLAAREGALHVGDIILGVDGMPLKGERVPHQLNTTKKGAYELTIARSTHTGGPGVHGEHEGWVVVAKARNGELLPLQWPRKYWLVLDANPRAPQLLLNESSRGGKTARTQLLAGAICKTPVMMLKGAELKQPPAIATFLHERRFPFTLTWPDGEVDHDLVLATATSTDRAHWSKALNKVLKALKAQAPTAGWLVKQGGRRKTGLSAMLSRDKKRWFVLEQPLEGANATFRYFDSPPPSAATPSRGLVVLNRDAKLLVDDQSKLPHAFCITSKGANDPMPISTTLAADSHKDLARWMTALRKAVADSGGEVAEVGDLMTAAGEKQRKDALHSNTAYANLVQLSQLEEDDLLQLRLKQLLEVAEHLQIMGTLDKGTRAMLKDKARPEPERKKKLADLIISQRKMHAQQDNFDLYEPTVAPQSERPKLKTWQSNTAMHEGGKRMSTMI